MHFKRKFTDKKEDAVPFICIWTIKVQTVQPLPWGNGYVNPTRLHSRHWLPLEHWRGGCGCGSAVRSPCCSCRKPESNSQHPHPTLGSLKPPVTLTARNPTINSRLQKHLHSHITYTHRHRHKHNFKMFKCLDYLITQTNSHKMYFYLLLLCVRVHVTCVYGDQRTALWSQSCPSTLTWVRGWDSGHHVYSACAFPYELSHRLLTRYPEVEKCADSSRMYRSPNLGKGCAYTHPTLTQRQRH